MLAMRVCLIATNIARASSVVISATGDIWRPPLGFVGHGIGEPVANLVHGVERAGLLGSSFTKRAFCLNFPVVSVQVRRGRFAPFAPLPALRNRILFGGSVGESSIPLLKNLTVTQPRAEYSTNSATTRSPAHSTSTLSPGESYRFPGSALHSPKSNVTISTSPVRILFIAHTPRGGARALYGALAARAPMPDRSSIPIKNYRTGAVRHLSRWGANQIGANHERPSSAACLRGDRLPGW